MQADLVVFGWAELMAFTGNSLSLKMTAVRELSSEIFIVMASASLPMVETPYIAFLRIVSADTFLFWKWKIWKFSYNFCIMAIFYFMNWIVAAKTIEGGELFKGGETVWRKYSVLLLERKKCLLRLFDAFWIINAKEKSWKYPEQFFSNFSYWKTKNSWYCLFSKQDF